VDRDQTLAPSRPVIVWSASGHVITHVGGVRTCASGLRSGASGQLMSIGAQSTTEDRVATVESAGTRGRPGMTGRVAVRPLSSIGASGHPEKCPVKG
jgi:hypothetical protein